nr:GspH/FimT family pseudopilin [Collimonas arenae]
MESMIVLAIMGVLLVVALPSMRTFVIRNHLAAATNQFIAAAILTRSEAIKRGRPVVICRSINADSGSDQCSGAATGGRDAGDWGAGWLVKAGDRGQVLWRQGTLDNSISVKATKYSITYDATGNASGAFVKLVFSSNSEYTRTVCIASSGRISLKLDSSLC